jgi:N-acetylmuramoyl-L-alanine amidase
MRLSVLMERFWYPDYVFSKIILLISLAAAIAVAGVPTQGQGPQGVPAQPAAPQATPPPTPAQAGGPPPQSAPPPSSAQSAQPSAPARAGFGVVVLDPAHGGADLGAHGLSGVPESEVVLNFARLLRIALESQGFHVLLTRQSNDDPSFDNRSKIVNAQRGAIFISLHVSSIGSAQTVRVYSLPKDNSIPAAAHPALLDWDHAQNGYADLSSRLASLIQIQMAQRFHGSPEIPMTGAVRQLRTVAAPAVAIEVSNVSLANRGPLDQMGGPLADGVARAVAAFRLVYTPRAM